MKLAILRRPTIAISALLLAGACTAAPTQTADTAVGNDAEAGFEQLFDGKPGRLAR